ncbi:MAG TPA: cation:proton antiporter, partial [Thermodesulfobacteriota bacterium]|nr:cation:proton antiporter [Thermodesulfobacteriota bacterium]
EWTAALMFGILIAATDPVSVVATFKEAGVHGRLRLLVEAESLLNDGTAAVGYAVIVLLAAGGTLSAAGTAKTLITTVAGGIACGAVVAAMVTALARRTADPLVEIVFTTFAAYTSFLTAEHFHFSGILASLTAGLMMGNNGLLTGVSPKGRDAVTAYWEFLGFLANSMIFMGIGLYLSRQNFAGAVAPAAIAVLVVLAGRALAVYPCCAVFAPSVLRVKKSHQHVLFWGGLRGALALALAMGLPSSVPHQEMIVSVAFAVVTFSILIQGLTMTPLLRRMGEIPPGVPEGKVQES